MNIDELLGSGHFKFIAAVLDVDVYRARRCQEKLKEAIRADDEMLIDQAWADWKAFLQDNENFQACEEIAFELINEDAKQP